jgi:cholesterol transport system auxiliary component
MKIYFSNIIMKTSQTHPRLASRVFLALFLASVFGLTGCISRPALNKHTFTFNAPAISATNIVASDRVLGIRSLQIAAPFEGRSFVYRTGEFSYARDPYAEFLGPPAEELLAPMRGWLRDSGNFSAVTEAGSALRPNMLVEISVSQLFGDFRQPEHPAAVVTIRFVFFDAPNGVPGKLIFQKKYSRRIPLNAPTANALMEGWNQALAEILAEVSSDFRAGLPKEVFENQLHG